MLALLHSVDVAERECMYASYAREGDSYHIPVDPDPVVLVVNAVII